MTATLLWFGCFIVSSCTGQHYQYLYADRFNTNDTSSDWQMNGNVSVVSTSKCPSTINKTSSSLFEGNKICIDNSYNSYWDGQYIWKYYDTNINASIYFNTNKNKYIY
eukprot:555400_1